ncbi:MAG: hypothetical protein JNL75_05775 [Chitinophagales bacterium]|nr:hypothetical protein [Chitinophagales bacterium]
MQETFTHTDLLKSIYGESDCCDNYKLKQEILKNPVLAEEYRDLKKSKSMLDAHLFTPKESTVNTILASSKRKEKELV